MWVLNPDFEDHWIGCFWEPIEICCRRNLGHYLTEQSSNLFQMMKKLSFFHFISFTHTHCKKNSYILLSTRILTTCSPWHEKITYFMPITSSNKNLNLSNSTAAAYIIKSNNCAMNQFSWIDPEKYRIDQFILSLYQSILPSTF